MKEKVILNRKEQKRLMVLNQLGSGVVTCREASEVLHLSLRHAGFIPIFAEVLDF